MEFEKTVTLGGHQKTIKMTFGLLNEMCRVCGELDGAAMLTLDNDLRVAALKVLLSDRDDQGKITSELNINTLDMAPDEVVELLDWASGHVTDFFLKAARKTKTRFEPIKKQIKDLTIT
jgi:hypothetical protein